MEIIKTLASTPLPTILVILGVGLFIIGLGARIPWPGTGKTIGVPKYNRNMALVGSFILFSIGLAIYVIPPLVSSPLAPTDGTATSTLGEAATAEPTAIIQTEAAKTNQIGTFTSVPFSTPTQVVMLTPSPTGIPLPGKDFETNCIHQNNWIPFKGEAHKVDNRGCWQLTDWGFVSQDGGLLISLDNSEKSKHGIYTEIPFQGTIEFEIRIDKFETGGSIGNVAFGIISADSVEDTGGLLLYQVESVELPPLLKVRKRGEDQYLDQDHILYKMETTQRIRMSLDGQLVIFVDGNQVTTPFSIPFENRAFWIGYDVPRDSNISGFLSKLSIEKK